MSAFNESNLNFTVSITGQLDKRHAPKDAPYPADNDDERCQLQQPDNNVDGERSSLGLDSCCDAAVEHAERRHQRA